MGLESLDLGPEMNIEGIGKMENRMVLAKWCLSMETDIGQWVQGQLRGKAVIEFGPAWMRRNVEKRPR